MPRKKSVDKSVDWRRLPRKPAEAKQSQQIAIRVTPAERAAIVTAAQTAGQTLRDYMVSRALS